MFVRDRVAGLCIGKKDYFTDAYTNQLASVGMAILGVYPGWSGDTGDGAQFRRLIAELKAKNPNIIVGNYTVMTESRTDTSNTYANHDIPAKLNQMNWWLRNRAGAKVQWTTSYGAYDINLTDRVRTDSNGKRWSQWLAQRNHDKFFKHSFDFSYSDNGMKYPRTTANWLLDNVDRPGNDPLVGAAWRRGQAAYWSELKRLSGKPIMVNADNDLSYPEYTKKADFALIEGAIGKSWSFSTWALLWARYNGQMKNLTSAKGSVLNAYGTRSDYAKLRYALCTVLLGDGRLAYTDSAVDYGSVPWFDEYNIDLGEPLYSVYPTGPLVPGKPIWRRTYTKAQVYVNTSNTETQTVPVPAGWRRFKGTQDANANNGQAITSLTLGPKQGLILVKA